MKKTSDGYDLEVIDSNYPSSTNNYRYTEGMTSLTYPYFGKFVPYLERKGEMENVALTVLKKCNPDEYKARKKKAKTEETENNNNSNYNGG